MRLCAAVLLLGGCSFAFVKGPDPDPPRRCTTGLSWPLVDSAGAAAGFTLATVAAIHVATNDYGTAEGDRMRRDTDRDIAVGLAAVGLVYTGAAVFGFYRVHACRNTSMPLVTPQAAR